MSMPMPQPEVTGGATALPLPTFFSTGQLRRAGINSLRQALITEAPTGTVRSEAACAHQTQSRTDFIP